MQEGRVVSYESRKLNVHEQKYPTHVSRSMSSVVKEDGLDIKKS
jgi:hypothetical protein